MPDIVITPNRGTTSNPKIDFTGTSAGTIKLEVLSDGTIAWNGANGSLFSIGDSLSGSLMSVNDISGLPAFEVFSDNRVIVGQFGANLLLGTTTNSSNGRLQLATHTAVTGGIGFGTDIGLYRIAANKLAFRGAADAEMSLRFNRAGGSYTTTWENYIPAASTDLRWYNGADRFTLTASGNATFSGYVVSTSGFATSGIYNYAFLQTTDSNNFWITPGNNQWGLYFETSAGGLLGGTGDSNRLGFVGNATARFYVDLNNGNGWFGGTATATQLISNVAQGTAPLVVTSTTQVSNLNTQYLNGYSSDTANNANTIVRRDGSGNFSAGTITASNISSTTLTQGGTAGHITKEYTFNLSAQSNTQFFPIRLTGTPIGAGGIHTIEVLMDSFGGADPYNHHSVVGKVRGSGWTDLPAFYDVFHNCYQDSERSYLGFYRGTQNCTDVVLYVRGGKTYYVKTPSTASVSTTALTVGDSVFAIKDSNAADVSGTSANISFMVNLITAAQGRLISHNFISGNNIGIGTTSPGYKLDVNGDGAFVSNGSARVLYLKQNANNTGNIIQFRNEGGGDIWELVGRNNQFYIYNTSLGQYAFYITPATGNVGIGTSTPGYKFDVTGTLRSTTDAYFATTSGSVGIGTTSPSAKLDISGNSVQDVGLVRFVNGSTSGTFVPTASFVQTRGNHSFGVVAEFRTNTAGDTDRPTILFRGAQAAHQWRVGQVTNGWGTNDDFGIGYVASNASPAAWPTNYFTIATGGNVGIGNTNPTKKLKIGSGTTTTVLGDDGIILDLGVGGQITSISSTNVQAGIATSTSFGYMGTWSNHPLYIRTNNSNRIIIESGGNVGIGLTSNIRGILHINGSNYSESPTVNKLITVSDSANSEKYMILGYHSTPDCGVIQGLHQSTAWKPVSINPNGANVGIGTASPSYKLDVNGDVRVTGTLIVQDGVASTNVFGLTTLTKSLTVTTSWIDVGISGSDLTTGSYIIQVFVDNYNVSGGQYAEYYTGFMSWTSGPTNSTDVDEIVLHKAGHAPNGNWINLRTVRQASSILKLQIIASGNTSGASNYVFKFRRMI